MISKSVSLLSFITLSLGLVTAPSVQAAVITFDDIATPGYIVPDGYKGLNWDNFQFQVGPASGAEGGFLNGTISYPMMAYNGFGAPATISSLTPFTFNSGYFTAAWSDGLTIDLVGYLGEEEKYSTSFTADTYGPTFLTLNWSGIDRFMMVGSGGIPAGYIGEGSHVVVDNLDISAVPLPAALPLMGLALVGLGGVAARRKAKA